MLGIDVPEETAGLRPDLSADWQRNKRPVAKAAGQVHRGAKIKTQFRRHRYHHATQSAIKAVSGKRHHAPALSMAAYGAPEQGKEPTRTGDAGLSPSRALPVLR